MHRTLREYLFSKNILVSAKKSDDAFETLVTLAEKFNIKIVSGAEYANKALILFLEIVLGTDIPDPFYRNFPQSVRALTQDKLLFDQLLHYCQTYGLGDFSEAGHSLFEEKFDRLAFNEKTDIRKCVILPVKDAVSTLREYVEDMLKSTRRLNNTQMDVIKTYIDEYDYEIKVCACKDTAIRLLSDSRDPEYTRFLSLSDVIKLVDRINYDKYANTNLKKLNLRNQDRKFIARVIDSFFENRSCKVDVRECFEKKAIWCGLLHHIHYAPKTQEAQQFVALMRGKENQSVYAEFEQAMLRRDIKSAVTCLSAGKGSGALLRHLNYIVSRCSAEEDFAFVLNSLDTKNAVILIQLLLQYSNETVRPSESRAFIFSRYNKMTVHRETDDEVFRRKSRLSPLQAESLALLMRKKLKALLHGKLGKVYISSKMYSIAVPLSENTACGGFGILPKGSRIHLKEWKKIRAFTYWKGVDDIDLSIIGLSHTKHTAEFSFRTMSNLQSFGVTFSGDQTSGYDGGSEYYDIDVDEFKKRYPSTKYLVFCNNVFSREPFSTCTCYAGYMLRDIDDSGEIFEPKTVESKFIINCDSTFAYLFAIDLEKNDFVWLNAARDSNAAIAGETELSFLTAYFNTTSVLNVGTLFEMLASEVVSSPEDADVAVSDEDIVLRDGAEIIRSFDTEKIAAFLQTT